jgi:hypothetical protein
MIESADNQPVGDFHWGGPIDTRAATGSSFTLKIAGDTVITVARPFTDSRKVRQ